MHSRFEGKRHEDRFTIWSMQDIGKTHFVKVTIKQTHKYCNFNENGTHTIMSDEAHFESVVVL